MQPPLSPCFTKFAQACTFFKGLESGTQIHYSENHKEFIRTATTWSYFPGAQKAANFLKGHKTEDLIKNLNGLRDGLLAGIKEEQHKALDPQECSKVIAEFRELKDRFESAKKGELGSAGLIGLQATYDGDTAIGEFIASTEKMINLAIQELEAAQSNADLEERRARHQEELFGPPSREQQLLMESFAGSGSFALSNEELEESSNATALQAGIEAPQDLEKEVELSDDISLGKAIAYRVSLNYNIVMGMVSWNWWNQVDLKDIGSDAEIFLGAIPISRTTLYGTDDFTNLKDLGINAVLSVVEPFEMNTPGYVVNPIRANQWIDAGMEHMQISTPDFETMSIDDIDRGVEFINKNVQEGNKIYIHCKAGRGRSALVLTCYLIKYHGMTAEDAIALIQKSRPQAKLEKAKMDSAKEYEAKFKPAVS